jgi:hypothetical protein
MASGGCLRSNNECERVPDAIGGEEIRKRKEVERESKEVRDALESCTVVVSALRCVDTQNQRKLGVDQRTEFLANREVGE